MDARSLLQTLLNLSEQAAYIARLVREDKALFKLLIASKDVRINGEPDFKTLADVLIQVTVQTGISQKFPAEQILVAGEEDSLFPTERGDVKLAPTSDPKETRRQLSLILPDSGAVVDTLTNAVHTSMEVHDDTIRQLEGISLPEEISIWIDPIDSTNSYIKGGEGLESVTVLIGVHSAGSPIMGCVAYPFSKTQSWGFVKGNDRYTNVPRSKCSPMIETVLMSNAQKKSEHAQLYALLEGQGYRCEYPKGAGHKLHIVISGEANLYLVTNRGTYPWDTCGPHAILKALGGDVVTLAPPHNPIPYGTSAAGNVPFVAYTDPRSLERFLGVLKEAKII